MHGFLKRCLLVVVGGLAAGCGRGSNPSAGGSQQELPIAAHSSYRLPSEPAGAQDVKLARQSAKNDEDVVVVGRIGGAANPWVDGMAAFMIADVSLEPCTDGCARPWDYCCDLDKLPTSKVMVRVVDGQGQVVATESRELLGVKELQTVVVRGKARRDEAGNLTVLADGVFVRP